MEDLDTMDLPIGTGRTPREIGLNICAEAVWPSDTGFASELKGHEFKDGRWQLSVILFQCTGRTLVYHLCSPHMPQQCSVAHKKLKTKCYRLGPAVGLVTHHHQVLLLQYTCYLVRKFVLFTSLNS